jgi:hypothetical protein
MVASSLFANEDVITKTYHTNGAIASTTNISTNDMRTDMYDLTGRITTIEQYHYDIGRYVWTDFEANFVAYSYTLDDHDDETAFMVYCINQNTRTTEVKGFYNAIGAGVSRCYRTK